MGESRLALQVLLILLVLAGAPKEAVAAPLEWSVSSDPTRVIFQAIETRGENTRSATLYGDGRVELWQETPRSPAFQQRILWFDEAQHRELITGAIKSGLPDWGDDASLARLLRSRLGAAKTSSGEEQRRVLLILQSTVDGVPYEVIRTLELPAQQAISADLGEQLPEFGWASRWATVLLDAKQLQHDGDRAGLPPLESAAFELMADFEKPIIELRITSMDMVTTRHAVFTDGRRVKEVSRKPAVTEQLSRAALVGLVQSLVRAGVAEWHEGTLLAKLLRLNAGRPVVSPSDESNVWLVLRFARYQRGSYVREPLIVEASATGLGFFKEYFPEVPEYRELLAFVAPKAATTPSNNSATVDPRCQSSPGAQATVDPRCQSSS